MQLSMLLSHLFPLLKFLVRHGRQHFIIFSVQDSEALYGLGVFGFYPTCVFEQLKEIYASGSEILHRQVTVLRFWDQDFQK